LLRNNNCRCRQYTRTGEPYSNASNKKH